MGSLPPFQVSTSFLLPALLIAPLHLDICEFLTTLRATCFLQLMRNLSEHTFLTAFHISSCQQESSTHPPLFPRSLKINQTQTIEHLFADLQNLYPSIPFFGGETQAKKATSSPLGSSKKVVVPSWWYASALWPMNCRVAPPHPSDLVKSPTPPFEAPRRKGANQKWTGFFRGVGGCFFWRELFFKTKNTCHRQPSYCKMLNLEPCQKYCHNVGNFTFWYTTFNIIDVRAKLCQHVCAATCFMALCLAYFFAAGAENNNLQVHAV